MARKTTYGKGTRYGDYAPKYRWGSWGKAFLDYTELRDIYPREFYQKIVNRGLCIDGQSVLDVGTGTGVLPGNMYPYGPSGLQWIFLKTRLNRPKFWRMLKPEGLPWSRSLLTKEQMEKWEGEHRALLERIAPNAFEVLHYGALAELKRK